MACGHALDSPRVPMKMALYNRPSTGERRYIPTVVVVP